ncbi:MAG: hypothetical protein OQL28_13725, partial [Sedimenticola sp.]|nr:hypothetical protein [Sedimenticola sp.]
GGHGARAARHYLFNLHIFILQYFAQHQSIDAVTMWQAVLLFLFTGGEIPASAPGHHASADLWLNLVIADF